MRRLRVFLVGFMFATACASATQDTPIEFPALTPGRAIPSATPATATIRPATAVSVSTAAPTIEPLAISVAPVITATLLRFESWSPDGAWLAVWAFDSAEAFSESATPRGTLYFFNARTGRACEFPYIARYNGMINSSIVWQADGNVAVLTSQPPRYGAPCADDYTELPALIVNPDHDPSRSPNGNYRATTQVQRAGRAETTVIDTRTGEVANVVEWQPVQAGNGAELGGAWLTDDLFLIPYTLDQGPLLLPAGKAVIQIGPELFKRTCEPGAVCWGAAGAVDKTTGQYHLVLLSADQAPGEALIYHSENGRVEAVARRTPAGFSPDGRYLVLYTVDPDGKYGVYMRPLDPPESGEALLRSADGDPFPLSWSPDSTRVAMSWGEGLTLFTTSDGAPIRFWRTDAYVTLPEFLWSPDGRLLASFGKSGKRYVLFVTPIP